MKFEFNKQRIVGVAILVVFLAIAVPFLFAGAKKTSAVGDNSAQIPLEIASTQDQSQSLTAPASKTDEDKTAEASDNADIDVLTQQDAGVTPQQQTATKPAQDATDGDIFSDDAKATPAATAASAVVPELPKPEVEVAKDEVQPDAAISTTDTSATAATSTATVAATAVVPTHAKSVATTPAQPVTTKHSHKVAAKSPVAHKQYATTTTTATAKTTTKASQKNSGKNKATATKTTTTVAPKGAVSSVVWFVQIGDFSDYDLAKNVVAKLKAKGHEKVAARKVAVKNGAVVRIFIGPSDSKKQAYALAGKISSVAAGKKVIVLQANKAGKTAK